MDSTRLIINNYDLSTATKPETTNVAGYTVIKAPKGPITPIRVAKGSSVRMQNIFGVPSEKYPDLLEASAFNSEYDLYISSPYTSAKVPMAYVTSDGIFLRKDTAEYNENVENYIYGKDLEGENLPGAYKGIPEEGKEKVEVLRDMKYPVASNLFSNVKDYEKWNIIYPEFDGENLLIHTGISADTLSESAVKKIIGKEEAGQHIYEGIEVLLRDLPSSKNNDDIKLFICIDKYIKSIKFETKQEKNGPLSIDTENTKAEYSTGNVYINYTDSSLGTKVGELKFKDGNSYSSCAKLNVLASSTVRSHLYNVGDIDYPDNKDNKPLTEMDDIVGTIRPDKPINTSEPIINNAEGTTIAGGICFIDRKEAIISIDNLAPLFNIDTSKNEDHQKNEAINIIESEDARKNIKSFYYTPISTDNIYASIFSKFPSTNRIDLSFEAFNSNLDYTPKKAFGRNLLKMVVSDSDYYPSKIYISGSLDSRAKDAAGAPLGIERSASYREQDLIGIYPIKPFTEGNSNINYYAPITLSGGERHLDDGIYEKGWSIALNDDDFSDVDIFFESRLYPVIFDKNNAGSLPLSVDGVSTFAQLGEAKQLSGNIFNQTIDPELIAGHNKSISSDSITLLTGDNTTPLDAGSRYWNVCNEGIVEFINTGKKVVIPLTGIRALMQARIIEHRCGGVAPMYLNSGNPAMGGQLPVSRYPGVDFISLRYKYNKNDQKVLDALNYNPVIRDSTYGVMSVGQKTCQSGGLTDWSYIGHVCSFLNFQKEVKQKVMIPQLGKANNDYYRTLRKQQVESILSKRLDGSNRIWTQAVVDTSTNPGVNDITNRRAKKFVIGVKVKVDIFSEFVELNFTNVDQGMSLI